MVAAPGLLALAIEGAAEGETPDAKRWAVSALCNLSRSSEISEKMVATPGLLAAVVPGGGAREGNPNEIRHPAMGTLKNLASFPPNEQASQAYRRARL